MKVNLEEELAIDLISFKLQQLSKNIQSILQKWQQENVDDFVEKARIGELHNAEPDAITIRQIMKDYHILNELLASITRREAS